MQCYNRCTLIFAAYLGKWVLKVCVTRLHFWAQNANVYVIVITAAVTYMRQTYAITLLLRLSDS